MKKEIMEVCRNIKFNSFNNYKNYYTTYLVHLYLQAERKEDFYNAELFADVIIFILRKYTDKNYNYNFIYEAAKTIKDDDIRKITIDDLNEDVYNYHKDLPYGYYLWDIHINSLLSLLKKCIIHLVWNKKGA